MTSTVLSHLVVRSGSVMPDRTALLLHGILGSGANLKSLASRLTAASPRWQIVLPDLRAHGASAAGAGPHTLAACAADLDRLAEQLGVQPELAIGHSFGGKVVLEYAARRPEGLERVWVLDSPPGRRLRERSDRLEQSAVDVIAALRRVALPVRSRRALVDELVGRGLTRPIALWMTTNLAEADGGWRWKFDLGAVEQMLESYLDADLWPLLERPPAGVRIEVLRAERSEGWSESDLEALERLERAGRLRAHLLRDSGHWVHVDNPEGLFELLAPSFSDD